MFFSPANKKTALGMYSPLYFIALTFFMTITVIGIILSRKIKKENVRKIIIGIGIFLWLTEFGKMIFVGVQYGIKEVEFLPLYFCSMTMYAALFFLFKSETLKTTACSFLFFGGIVGAITFFLHPSACIPNYPLFHYMTLRTFIYHSLMIYMGFLIVITGFYKPNFSHFKHYLVFLGITFILAYAINLIKGTNLMYIQEPININISKWAYTHFKGLYPFMVGILEAVVPFMVSYGCYYFITSLKLKKEERTLKTC